MYFHESKFYSFQCFLSQTHSSDRHTQGLLPPTHRPSSPRAVSHSPTAFSQTAPPPSGPCPTHPPPLLPQGLAPLNDRRLAPPLLSSGWVLQIGFRPSSGLLLRSTSGALRSPSISSTLSLFLPLLLLCNPPTLVRHGNARTPPTLTAPLKRRTLQPTELWSATQNDELVDILTMPIDR